MLVNKKNILHLIGFFKFDFDFILDNYLGHQSTSQFSCLHKWQPLSLS